MAAQPPGPGFPEQAPSVYMQTFFIIIRRSLRSLSLIHIFPVFYCSDCGKPVCTDETIKAVSDIFREKGSNAWFEMDAAELLPEGFTLSLIHI